MHYNVGLVVDVGSSTCVSDSQHVPAKNICQIV